MTAPGKHTEGEAVAEFPRKASSESGSEVGYCVEARLPEYADPCDVGGNLLTHRWKRVEWKHVTPPLNGVPAGASYERSRERWGLLSYQAAQALRWWLHAQIEAAGFSPKVPSSASLETRVVKHEITYQSTCTAVSAHGHVHGEDRSNIIPDWGTAKATGDAK